MVHNVTIDVDVELLQNLGLNISDELIRIEETTLRLSSPTAHLEVGTVVGKNSMHFFGRTLNRLGDMARSVGSARQLTIRAPQVVNPELAKTLLSPRFLDLYQLELLKVSGTNLLLYSQDAIDMLRDSFSPEIIETRPYQEIVQRRQFPVYDITLACDI